MRLRLYTAALLAPFLLLTACSTGQDFDVEAGIEWTVRSETNFGDGFRMNYLTGEVTDTRLFTPTTNILENPEEERPDAINKAKYLFCQNYFSPTQDDKIAAQQKVIMDIRRNARYAAVAEMYTHEHANAVMNHADVMLTATASIDYEQLWEETYPHLVETDAEIRKIRDAEGKSIADTLPELQVKLTNYCEKSVPENFEHPSLEDLGYGTREEE